MKAALEKDHNQRERREDRPHLPEIRGRDHVQQWPDHDAGQHQDQDVRNFGAFEKPGQEMTGKDQEADTEDGDFHSGKTTTRGETWEVGYREP